MSVTNYILYYLSNADKQQKPTFQHLVFKYIWPSAVARCFRSQSAGVGTVEKIL